MSQKIKPHSKLKGPKKKEELLAIPQLNPRVELLVKLGSALVHFDEISESEWFAEASRSGPAAGFDLAAIKAAFDDEVRQWLSDMGPLLPLKRSTR